MATIRARLATGEVEGAHVGATAVFKGIPFATISARFGPPAPTPAWDEVLSLIHISEPTRPY